MWIRKTGVCALLLAALLIGGCSGNGADDSSSAAMQQTRPDKRETIETMLVFCIDQDERSQDTGDYRNGNRAELLLLMVVDKEQETTRVLQLNPDTVVSFTPPGTQEALTIPLGEVYSYGSGGSDSGFAQLKAVSKFLDGVTMDHYLMFTMDAVAIVNDFVGGVSLALTEELAEHFPEKTVGEEVVVNGEQALAYLRHREPEDADGSRYMLRQNEYMLGLLPDLFHKAQDDEFLTQLTLEIGEGMATDLTLSQMALMLEQLDMYDLDETVLTLAGSGEMKDGQRYFHVEEESRREMLDSLFY